MFIAQFTTAGGLGDSASRSPGPLVVSGIWRQLKLALARGLLNLLRVACQRLFWRHASAISRTFWWVQWSGISSREVIAATVGQAVSVQASVLRAELQHQHSAYLQYMCVGMGVVVEILGKTPAVQDSFVKHAVLASECSCLTLARLSVWQIYIELYFCWALTEFSFCWSLSCRLCWVLIPCWALVLSPHSFFRS